ncbi:MAG: response regulator [Phycisphaerales bacterium]|jgi:DNA-binding NtrC family response regulator|nr:response regulator [Phycisphaerales bacterium]
MPAPEHETTEGREEVAPAPPLAIVSLDDDEDFREYLRGLLGSAGHDVRTVGTSEEFFAACGHRLPDVVLLDMKMGHDSGEEVLAELRRRWPRLCVIVVTGYPSLDSMRSTFKRDVFDYLAKPFSANDLHRALAQAAAAYGLGQSPQDKLRAQLGRQIRMARTDRGWTLKELSEASGVSISQLSAIERGAHLPSLESLVSIAEAFEQKASAWLGESGF